MAWDSEQQNADQFQLLHESRLLMKKNGHQAGAPQFAFSDASIQAYLKELNPTRNLANLVSDAALFSHLNSNDNEATGRMLDCANIADCVRQTHVIVGQLVAIGIEALNCENISVIAPGLRVSSDSAEGNARAHATKLIHWLLDDAGRSADWDATMAQELGYLSRPQPLNVPATEQARFITLKEAKDDELLIEKADQAKDLPTATAFLKQCGPALAIIHLDPLFTTKFRVIAERRMAAADLAIQLYRVDYHGEFPKSLDQLVPSYLPNVPRDPFSSDNNAIGYKIIAHGWPNGKDRPLLFVDTGPDFKLDAEPRVSWYNHKKYDVRQYRDLTLPK